MRIAAAATASLFAITVIGAAVEIKTFGFPFFVFRTAVGESGPGVPTDQQFLAQEAAAGVHRHNATAPATVHVAPPKTHHAAAAKGRHAVKSPTPG
jgi:biotin carboxyl carrier protein